MAFDLNLAHMSISELLEKAAESNEVIHVKPGQQRGIGKTPALIDFARKNKAPVLTNRAMADHYKKIHPDLIFIGYWDGKDLSEYENIVCDELIPLEVAEELHKDGKLLTGFVNLGNHMSTQF